MNKLRLLLVALFASVSLSIPTPSALAGVGDDFGLSPFADWQQIKTDHFRIVFPKELSARAPRIAQLYEEAHRDLKGEMRWEPWWRVNVILVDNSDAANGLTTPLSRFGMLLYLTSPDTFSAIDHYDDWLKLLIYHEYTHFLNMDATRDFYVPLRYVFGDVILPNSAWPAWMLEGYAVFNETKFTGAGRGRSPYWDGILRSAVETGTLGEPEFITLDQFNGTHPRFPSGESIYLFGYHLMNTAERTRPYTLSEMTERSSSRIPFFINGNLENIVGKDWYALWDEWVALTKTQMKAQLATLASAPTSQVERLDGTRDDSIGIAFSPDGKWVAYSTENEDEWQTLKVREWKNGVKEAADEAHTVDEKFYGAGIAFTPDSKRIVYSSLHRWKNYNFYSDLRVHEPETNTTYWLTEGLRARDPDLSRDGNWVVFTQTNDAGTDLILGKLVIVKGKLRLEARRKLVDAAPLERIANPKLSPDLRGVVFSWKRVGKTQDDLYYYDFKRNSAAPILADGFRNRFAAYDTKGALHFVSDRTGVDNLYRWNEKSAPTLVTNVTSGLWLPTFRGPDLYASVLSKDGFSFAKVSTFPNGIDPAKITVKVGENAPKGAAAAGPAIPENYPIEKYSAWPTLAPRQWAPIYLSDLSSTFVGGQVFGYDNVFRHQYFAYGGHETTSKAWDYSFQYENRSFGPTLQLYASRLTTNIISAKQSVAGDDSFVREAEAGARLSFPFQGTTSRLTPTLGASFERNIFYVVPGGTGPKLIAGQTRYVPEQDFTLEHQDTRRSRLAVSQERGSATVIGARRYDMNYGVHDIYKGIFKHTRFLNLGNHFVLSPSFRAMKVNRRDLAYLESSAISRGKRNRLVNPLYSDNFDEFGIRGYPQTSVYSREALTLSTDLKFPVAQIFRGWGTNPVFIDQLWMQLFAEDTYRPNASPKFQHLAAAGAGLRLNTELFLALPLSFNIDYHYGFNENAGGQDEIFFSIGASSILPF